MAERLFVGTRKGLFVVRRGRRGWTLGATHFLGDPVSALLPDARDATVYVALNHGHFGVKLHRSADGGRSWQACAAPVYPPKPEAVADSVPWTLEQVWCLESGGQDRPGRLWAGTHPGGLFRSDDRGDSWALNTQLWERPERKEWFGGGYDHPGIHSVCVDPRDPACITLAVSCGGVWRSEDDGRNWALVGAGMLAPYMPPGRRDDANIQDVHRMVACPARPEVMWAQHHHGIYRSRDGGRRWRALKGTGLTGFGFACVVHPHDPDTAWLVPADSDGRRVPADARVVVARTRDGGASFELISRGLPPAPAYDLVYRHALDVDETGSRLAFGSTTGGLWVSEDQGSSWHCVSAHLPPIYCLRFGA